MRRSAAGGWAARRRARAVGEDLEPSEPFPTARPEFGRLTIKLRDAVGVTHDAARLTAVVESKPVTEFVYRDLARASNETRLRRDRRGRDALGPQPRDRDEGRAPTEVGEPEQEVEVGNEDVGHRDPDDAGIARTDDSIDSVEDNVGAVLRSAGTIASAGQREWGTDGHGHVVGPSQRMANAGQHDRGNRAQRTKVNRGSHACSLSAQSARS